nr:oligosaccharide flippase family protein [Pseudoalteromonas sp. NGC95]
MRLRRLLEHSVTKNSFALIFLQLFAVVAPLLVFPYLTRMLSLENFGLVMLAISACSMALVFTDFGFNLSATYHVSKKRKYRKYISQYIGAIFILKILLVLALCILIFFYNIFFGSIDGMFVLSIIFNIAAQTFFPTWFFQGIEKMKNITIYMLFSKILFVVLIFLLIDKESLPEEIMFIYAISNFFALSIAFRCIYLSGYRVCWPKKISLVRVFSNSVPFFISRASVALYTSASTFLVGVFSGTQQAAIYGASEKLFLASQSVTGPIAQALFPYMAKNGDRRLIFLILGLVGIPLSLIAVITGVWASEIMSFIFGPKFYDAGQLLQIFLIVTIVNFISVILGYPAFASIGKVSIANKTVVFGAAIQSVFLFLLYISDLFSALSIVLTVLFTETLVMFSRVILYLKHR